MDLGLAGKIAIVTGSTRGLGFATARSLLEEGCNVTICARGEEGLAEAMGELRRLPGGAERWPFRPIWQPKKALRTWCSAPSTPLAVSTSS